MKSRIVMEWYDAKKLRPAVSSKYEMVWVVYLFGCDGRAHVACVTYENGLFNGSESYDKDVLYWAYAPDRKQFEEEDDF